MVEVFEALYRWLGDHNIDPAKVTVVLESSEAYNIRSALVHEHKNHALWETGTQIDSVLGIRLRIEKGRGSILGETDDGRR